MTYIVQRHNRFYVVAYDGLDPLTGRERRRWHPVGHDRDEAEALAARLDLDRAGTAAGTRRTDHGSTTSSLERGCRTSAARSERPPPTATPGSSTTTSHPPSATSRCDGCAPTTSTTSTSSSPPPAAATGRARAQDRARGPHDRPRRARPGRAARARRPQRRPRRPRPATPSRGTAPPGPGPPTSWPPSSTAARRQRLYPALHLAAHTGMRRGEIVGLKWSDLDRTTRTAVDPSDRCRASPGDPSSSASRPAPAGAASTSTQPPSTELDRWRRRLRLDGLPHGPDDWMFCNPTGRFLNPESLSQLFDRIVQRADAAPHPLPRPAPHPRLAARRRRRADQGRQRTPRPRPPRRSRCTPTSTSCPA